MAPPGVFPRGVWESLDTRRGVWRTCWTWTPRLVGTPPLGRLRRQSIEQVLSLTELCDHLHVSARTIYDLRSQGRGPRGFRVGRELTFRVSEIEAWLARMESEDAHRHKVGGR